MLKDRARMLVFLVSLIAFVPSCSFLSSTITYYDPSTYRNLTDLKPQTVFLYRSFGAETIDSLEIYKIRLKIAQMVEYEKGKGEKNRETAQQLRIIQGMFEDDLAHRIKNGKWTPAQTQNQVENISDAFDIAISTERLKNKNE